MGASSHCMSPRSSRRFTISTTPRPGSVTERFRSGLAKRAPVRRWSRPSRLVPRERQTMLAGDDRFHESSSVPVDRPHPWAPLSCMECDSEPVATAFHGCRSEAQVDRALADPWFSSQAAASLPSTTTSAPAEAGASVIVRTAQLFASDPAGRWLSERGPGNGLPRGGRSCAYRAFEARAGRRTGVGSPPATRRTGLRARRPKVDISELSRGSIVGEPCPRTGWLSEQRRIR